MASPVLGVREIVRREQPLKKQLHSFGVRGPCEPVAPVSPCPWEIRLERLCCFTAGRCGWRVDAVFACFPPPSSFLALVEGLASRRNHSDEAGEGLVDMGFLTAIDRQA